MSVAGFHVDSIHTNSHIDTGKKHGEWKREITGNVFYEGIGSYTYCDDEGEVIKATGGNLFGAGLFTYSARRFEGIGEDPEWVRSKPLLLDEAVSKAIVDDTIYSNKYTYKGWLR
jgi:hypothetical protein